MSGFTNDVMFADNVDFTGGHPVTGKVTANGQLLIGSGVFPNIRVGLLTSTNGSINIAVGPGTIDLSTNTNDFDFSNLGIAHSGTTFTVQGFNGNALSSTNPAVVWLQNRSTPGQLTKYVVTANQTFTDGAAGQITTMRWDLTAGVNASTDIPFYLYAVGNDAQSAIAFMISRIPHATTSPVAASIGKVGALVNTGQGDFYSLANITVTDYDSNPCILIGSFRMQFVGGTNSWTVQTLTTSDGVGLYQEGKTFSVPRGQFTAAAGKWFQNNGGTAPDDTGGVYTYQMDKTGMVHVDLSLESVDVAGVGAVEARAITPIKRANSITCGTGYWVGAGGSPGSTLITQLDPSPTPYFTTVFNEYNGVLTAIITSNIFNEDLGVTAVFRMHSSFQASL